MKPGRVLVLHAITDPISTVLIRGQLAWLKANGFDPALLCSPGPRLDLIAAEEAIPIFPSPITREISPLADLRTITRVYRLLRNVRPIICNAGTPKAGLLVGLAAWLAGVPCRIYTLRGLRLETATGLRRALLTMAEKISCFTAHRVICVSPSLRQRALELHILNPEKAVLLGTGSSNGVDSLRFAPTPEKAAQAASLRVELGIRPEQMIVGFAGRLTRDKGIADLIAAWQSVQKAMPEAVLVLVGDFEDGDPVPANIRDFIESDPTIRRVPFNSQIDLYYLVMDLYVLPTYREGFPNTVLEAQSSGLPVVTTTATGARDSIENGVTGLLVPVGDYRLLARAILSLIIDPPRLRSMGRAARERVLREFRSEMIWEGLASLYRTMLNERGYPSPEVPTASISTETPRCAQVR